MWAGGGPWHYTALNDTFPSELPLAAVWLLRLSHSSASSVSPNSAIVSRHTHDDQGRRADFRSASEVVLPALARGWRRRIFLVGISRTSPNDWRIGLDSTNGGLWSGETRQVVMEILAVNVASWYVPPDSVIVCFTITAAAFKPTWKIAHNKSCQVHCVYCWRLKISCTTD